MTTVPSSLASLPILLFANQQEWADWLDSYHPDSPGLWLRLAKKSSGMTSVTYDEAVEVALCYGWIDGQKKSLDAESWLQKFTPRRPKSIWSKVNTEKAQRLIEEGKMRPAGLRQVELAKQDGRWAAAYEPQSTSVVPGDLQTALEENAAAMNFFAALDGRNRYAILFRIQSAKQLATRARRIEQFIDMLANHEKLYP